MNVTDMNTLKAVFLCPVLFSWQVENINYKDAENTNMPKIQLLQPDLQGNSPSR